MLLERWGVVKESLSAALVAQQPPSDAEVRAWVALIGRLHIGAVMRLASGVWASARARGEIVPSPRSIHALYRRMLVSALRDPIDLGALAVDGDDLRRAGILPGPGLGRILQALLASVVADPARNTTDWLLQEAQRLDAESPRNAGHTDRR
jgi:tRNA nucleotidyltransferase (CCA-adding enzyme)